MNRREEYICVERERIAELVAKINDLRVLGQIYKFVLYMTKEGDRSQLGEYYYNIYEKEESQMKDERKQIIEELNKEIEGMRDIAVMRFILDVTRAFKEKWGA